MAAIAILWIPLIISVVICLVKLLVTGMKGFEKLMDTLIFVLLVFVVSALVSIGIDFLLAMLGGTAFAFTVAGLIPYFVYALVGAIIIPIGVLVAKLKLD